MLLSKSGPPNIGQFVSGCRKGFKFYIVLVSFVWKVNCLNQKIFAGVLFCGTEEFWKVWAKTECCFPNQPPQNWSICFELPERLQVLYCIGFFCLKGKLLEPKNLCRRFVLWHWIALEGLGQNWMLLSKSGPPNIGQFVSGCRKGFKFYIVLVSFVWKVNCLNQKLRQEFYSVTLKGFRMFQAKLTAAFVISPIKNWSIYFELPKRLQISYFIAFFCLKGKLL